MTEFWLISVPGEKDPDIAFQRLTHHLSTGRGLSQQWKFNIPPDLKVGTLDSLVGISDELAKLDVYADGVTKKMAQYMADILEGQRSRLEDNLTVNGLTPTAFLTKFTWDYAKYPIKQTLPSLFSILSTKLSKIEEDLKVKADAYNAVKGCLQTLERKQTGSLLTRELGDIVKGDQFVIGSEYMTTLVVVIPRNNYSQWMEQYETLTEMVVPKSTELIFEDSENGLWTVTVFQKMVNDFKNRAKECKFVVRDFEYDEKKIVKEKMEMTKLASDKWRQFGPLFRWLKVNFGESLSALIHIKGLRVFVESVLRYGLPVNFQAVLIQPNEKAEKRLRELLHQLYHRLDGASASSILDDDLVLAGFGPVADYYPYVSFRVDLNIIDVHQQQKNNREA